MDTVKVIKVEHIICNRQEGKTFWDAVIEYHDGEDIVCDSIRLINDKRSYMNWKTFRQVMKEHGVVVPPKKNLHRDFTMKGKTYYKTENVVVEQKGGDDGTKT